MMRPFYSTTDNQDICYWQYLSAEHLSRYVGKVLTFQTPTGVRSGKLKKDGNDLLLPYCGWVRANTCKILMVYIEQLPCTN